MALTRRDPRSWLDPWRELDDMSARMARYFEGRDLARADWTPSVDVSESESEYRIRAALPDVKKEDVSVSLGEGVLTIRGERKQRKEEKDERVHRVEIQEGTFLRTFAMPDDADAEKVSAKLEDGMLDVTIAKTEKKAAGARQITIR